MLKAHRRLFRTLLAGALALALSATAGCGSTSKSGTAGTSTTAAKNLDLCGVFSASELAAAHITGSCVQAPTQYREYRNLYSAQWGTNVRGKPFHSLTVTVKEWKGPYAAQYVKFYERELLPKGSIPFEVKNGIGALQTRAFVTFVNPSAPAPKNGSIPPIVHQNGGEARVLVGEHLGSLTLFDASASEQELEKALKQMGQTLAAEL
jgi:hypothetical protein